MLAKSFEILTKYQVYGIDMSRKGKKVVFDVGDAVMARWPGSKLWYEAVVLSTNYEEDVFQIRFPDGQENEVPYSHIAVSIKTNLFSYCSIMTAVIVVIIFLYFLIVDVLQIHVISNIFVAYALAFKSKIVKCDRQSDVPFFFNFFFAERQYKIAPSNFKMIRTKFV